MSVFLHKYAACIHVRTYARQIRAFKFKYNVQLIDSKILVLPFEYDELPISTTSDSVENYIH